MIKLKSASDGFEFTALHAPAKDTRKGGVVLIQEIFGLNKYMQEDVVRWADLGYEVIAPSMFDRQEPGYTGGHDEAGLQTGYKLATTAKVENSMGDVQACVDYLKPRGPVFLAGYCYGGWIGWLAAGRVQGLSAVSSYYGGFIKNSLDEKLNCPIICHFGQRDEHIKVDELTSAIKTAHPEVPVYVYENSGHGFNNDGRPDSDPADAALARQRTLELFQANGAGR